MSWAWVVQGLLNKQIAGQLGIKEITVKVRESPCKCRKCRRVLLLNWWRLSILIDEADRTSGLKRCLSECCFGNAITF
nr:LuxR C-terminal-related transcriptional regulator [Brucella pituitosa]